MRRWGKVYVLRGNRVVMISIICDDINDGLLSTAMFEFGIKFVTYVCQYTYINPQPPPPFFFPHSALSPMGKTKNGLLDVIWVAAFKKPSKSGNMCLSVQNGAKFLIS